MKIKGILMVSQGKRKHSQRIKDIHASFSYMAHPTLPLVLCAMETDKR